MIENIDRHIEMRKPLEDAIINAANEIVVPTLVATLAIAIVWLPLFRLTGSENTATRCEPRSKPEKRVFAPCS